MKALILNSGMGKRMGGLTSELPKCMTDIGGDTILGRQLRLLHRSGITEVVMTTGYFESVLVNYCASLETPLRYEFVANPRYAETNYIYSIYCARDFLDCDIVMMHGDLVFEPGVLTDLLGGTESRMTVSSIIPPPLKDFKATIDNGRIAAVGVDLVDGAVAAQPLYRIRRGEWKIWLDRIIEFCESGRTSCYAEDAFNEVSERCRIAPMEYGERLCVEIDTPEDLASVRARLAAG